MTQVHVHVADDNLAVLLQEMYRTKQSYSTKRQSYKSKSSIKAQLDRERSSTANNSTSTATHPHTPSSSSPNQHWSQPVACRECGKEGQFAYGVEDSNRETRNHCMHLLAKGVRVNLTRSLSLSFQCAPTYKISGALPPRSPLVLNFNCFFSLRYWCC